MEERQDHATRTISIVMIIALVGKWFPTGCHKVGASFGCLAPRLVTGQFDAGYHRAVWPSTGNYCRAARSTPSCWGSDRWPSSRRA